MLLLAHPDAPPCGPVRNFEVRAERSADRYLRLSWRLDADLSQLRVPSAVAPARADGLWRHTCFEAFVAVPGTPGYCEFNFSPSGEWAAYGFTSYRSGMTALDLPVAPEAHWRLGAARLGLDVALRPDELFSGMAVDSMRLALAAVIEDQSGTISHWALRHPEGKPDFHHSGGFALELAGSGSGADRGAWRS